MDIRVGLGYDIHKLVPDRKLVLGGVEIPFELGLLGHSDADALLHAITDAILGAAGLGDIGEHFPDTDEHFKDADSSKLLKAALESVEAEGWSIVNVDANVIAQAPKLMPYKNKMKERIAGLLEIDTSCVNVKARTNEKLDAVGQKQAIATQAVVLLQRETATN